MILVCGGSGIVGRELCEYLKSINIKFIGTYNLNKINKSLVKIDFNSLEDIENNLIKYKIKYCINCIVERRTDICENSWDNIKKINIDLVNNLCKCCKKLNIKLIHISTDYVFDGKGDKNYPDSNTNPLNNYGISKLIAEKRIINSGVEYVIIRVPVLYSNKCKLHENAITIIGKNLMNLDNKIISEDNYYIRRPLYIKNMLKFMIDVLNERNKIYHFYNPYNKTTKYKILNIINNILNRKIKIVEKMGYGTADRPYDTNLKDKYDINRYSFDLLNLNLNTIFNKFSRINIKESLFLIDLDNTIINSNIIHYKSYHNVFKKLGLKFMDNKSWNKYSLDGNFDDYLKLNNSKNEIENIKKMKLREYKKYCEKGELQLELNVDIFINYLIENNINFCVVTNSSKKTVNMLKSNIEILNKIEKWIYKDDVKNTKPNSDCYKLGIKRYKGECKNTIGIEDSYVGYNALNGIVDRIFIYKNRNIYKNEDVYYFSDYIRLVNYLKNN